VQTSRPRGTSVVSSTRTHQTRSPTTLRSMTFPASAASKTRSCVAAIGHHTPVSWRNSGPPLSFGSSQHQWKEVTVRIVASILIALSALAGAARAADDVSPNDTKRFFDQLDREG